MKKWWWSILLKSLVYWSLASLLLIVIGVLLFVANGFIRHLAYGNVVRHEVCDGIWFIGHYGIEDDVFWGLNPHSDLPVFTLSPEPFSLQISVLKCGVDGCAGFTAVRLGLCMRGIANLRGGGNDVLGGNVMYNKASYESCVLLLCECSKNWRKTSEWSLRRVDRLTRWRRGIDLLVWPMAFRVAYRIDVAWLSCSASLWWCYVV